MKCTIAFSVLVAFISVSAGALVENGRKDFPRENSPNLSWLTNSTLELKMGGKILNILLTPTTNIPGIHTPCLFEGKVQEEPLSEVAASGCINSNETLLSISSSQVPGGILDLALVDGITYDVTLDGHDESHGERRRRDTDIYEDEYAYDYFLPPGDETVEDETADFFIPPPNPTQPLAAFSGPLPSKVILKTNVKYDNSLLSHFQNSHQKTKDWINRVIGLAKPRMSHNSLSIRVDIQIEGVDHTDETIKANRERIYYLADKRIPSLTSYFCKDIGGGVIGIAFLRAACHTNGYAVNINEMYTLANSELRTARTYAHELGHNIGMLHDFAPVHGGRGGQCDKQGLMSYGQDRPDQWSTCSNTDYKNWWRNEGFACMKESTTESKVLFVDADNILDLPEFTHRDCSIPSYAGTDIERPGSGVIDGYLMTCGGLNFGNNCYSLQNGRWVKKADMTRPRDGLGASPYPGIPNSLMVTGNSAEILLPGEPWKNGPDSPSSSLYLHCQVTLGPSIIVTGGYNKNGEAWSWTPSEDGGSWVKLPDLNHGRFGHTCVVFEQTVYLIGGQGGYKPVETYKLGWNKWVDIDSLPVNSSRQAFVYDNKLYVIVDNGDVYVLKDNRKSWEKIASTGIKFPYSTYRDTFPSQVLDASSIGC